MRDFEQVQLHYEACMRDGFGELRRRYLDDLPLAAIRFRKLRFLELTEGEIHIHAQIPSY